MTLVCETTSTTVPQPTENKAPEDLSEPLEDLNKALEDSYAKLLEPFRDLCMYVQTQYSGNKPAASWNATFWFWEETLCFSNEALQFATKLPHNHKLENLSELWFHRLRYVPVVLHKLLCKPHCWCHYDINMKTGNWSCNNIVFSCIDILHPVYCDILTYCDTPTVVSWRQVRVRNVWKMSLLSLQLHIITYSKETSGARPSH